MTNPVDFYSTQSLITDPGTYKNLFDNLPRNLPDLHQCIQNVYIHVWKVRKHNPDWLKGRPHEYESRTIAKSLALVMAHDDRPLTDDRPKSKKLIIDCRHFAVLLASMLRHQGIPARVRCGFATYLEKSHYQDHWITEYWNGERWVLEDPDLLKHDMASETFITGGKAWQLIRDKTMSDLQFGFSAHELGEWAVRFDLPRDLAALNKMEMLSGDSWGDMAKQTPLVTSKDRKLLDEAATWSLTPDSDFEGMRSFYESVDSLRVPETIHLYNYITNKHKTVQWDDRPE